MQEWQVARKGGHNLRRGRLQEPRLKTDLDLNHFGDRVMYVKGSWQEKPQVCENRIVVSKVILKVHLKRLLRGKSSRTHRKGQRSC